MRYGRMTIPHSKKAARHKAGGFFDSTPQAARHSVQINASRIALRDVLCADQLFYAQLHVHRG
jgi:hypothetical protein